MTIYLPKPVCNQFVKDLKDLSTGFYEQGGLNYTSLPEIREWPGTHRNSIIVSREYKSKSEALILRIRGDVVAEIEIELIALGNAWESEKNKTFCNF